MAELRKVDRPRPFVVVLTGGPSAGKSSAIAVLRDRLQVRGFQVLTIPENATHFLGNSDGFQPEWAGTHSQVCMQRIFLDYQMAQEDAFAAFAELHPTKQAVLLLDSCTLNSKVYVSDEQWEQVLDFPGKPKLTEEQLLGRYDLVIHMVTCAHEGAAHYEYGPGSNNPGRYHTPEQAKESDARGLSVFAAHPQLRVVPHCACFEDKINKVLDFMNDALHVDGLVGKRRRMAVDVAPDGPILELVRPGAACSCVVVSTFVDEKLQHSVRWRGTTPNDLWLQRCRSHVWEPQPMADLSERDQLAAAATNVTYEQRMHMKCPEEPSKGFLTRRLIKEDDYHASVQSAAGGALATTKHVLSFVADTQYYELFFFSGYTGGLILDLAEDAGVPAWATIKASEPHGAPTPSRSQQSLQERPVKRLRVLSTHSTEEVALFNAAKPRKAPEGK